MNGRLTEHYEYAPLKPTRAVPEVVAFSASGHHRISKRAADAVLATAEVSA